MIIGIDPASTKIAVMYFDGVEYFWDEVKLPSPYTPANTHKASVWLYESIVSHCPPGQQTAFVEAPVVARGAVQGTIKQAMVSGAIQSTLLRSGIDTHLVSISAWKKLVVGKGNAPKEDVKAMMLAKYPFLKGASQDVMDAMGITQYGIVTMKKASNL